MDKGKKSKQTKKKNQLDDVAAVILHCACKSRDLHNPFYALVMIALCGTEV